MRESQVEKHFVRQVEARGGLTRKVRWLCRRGCPDRYAVFPGGRYAFVELKAPDEKLDDHQAREIKRLQAVGVRVVVLDSVEAVDRWLEQFA